MTEVLALTTRGVVRWRRPAPAGEVAAAAVVDRDERLYVVVKDGVRAIDGESGDTVWEISVPGARRLAFGGEGVLYVQAAGLRLVAIAGSNAVPD
jgi:outer membrane protein assembly factor BamB